MIISPYRRIKANAIARVVSSLLAVVISHQVSAAGPAPVNLGSNTNFAILSGAAITSVGGGIITGNVGASPIAGSAIGVTCAQVVGIIYAVDASGPACAVIAPALLTTAKGDLTTAYNDAAGRTPIPTGPFLNPNGGNIGGLNLGPGLYKFTGTALITGADVTLTGGPDDVFIFQIASDLQVGSGIKVILAGGAQAKNIFWQVGTSAVLGTFSVFNGTILADQSITINTSATMVGRALASSGGVTFNGSALTLPPSAAAVGPEIAVEQPAGVDLVDGVSSQDFGSAAVGATNNLIFTVRNTGTADLSLSGIVIDGADSSMFTVTSNPAALVVPGGSTTFTVSFVPASSGSKNAALHLANNDSNENPFDIFLSGTGAGAGAGGVAVIFFSPITLNPQTGLFEQSVRVSNTSPNPVTAVRLLIQGLPADVPVYNASGTTNGTPFVQYNGSLAAAGTVDFLIEYYRASRQPIPQPTFAAEATTPVTPTADGTIIAINRSVQLADGRFLIEFSAVRGRTYAVQYSSDMTTWKTATPTITAPSNRVQWYDDGPPKTDSKPTAGNRFYRVIRLP